MDKKKRSTKEKRRFAILTAIAIIALAIIGLRLFWIYIFDGDKYKSAALSRIETDSVAITARRGSVVDADGVQLRCLLPRIFSVCSFLQPWPCGSLSLSAEQDVLQNLLFWPV